LDDADAWLGCARADAGLPVLDDDALAWPRESAGQGRRPAPREIRDEEQTAMTEVGDLRQPLFSRDDALRFFLVCANQISRVQGQFNKLVIFDEAHEYLSEAFGEKLDSRIRLSRHEGTSYIFATQDVGSIPTEIQRFISTKCVFGLGSAQNVKDLLEFAPEFRGLELVELPTGQCFVQSTYSSKNFFSLPRLVRVRPRASAHGGTTRIFS